MHRQRPTICKPRVLYFCKGYDFKHTTSSPRFPQSNGLAEKGVQIVKRILKKTMEGKNDFWMGLLSYRYSPLEEGRSPGELLQGRPLPDFNKVPRTAVLKHEPAKSKRRCLPPLTTGQVVRVRGNTWETKAKVLNTTQPRSYSVVTEKSAPSGETRFKDVQLSRPRRCQRSHHRTYE